jgi:hypothetical protein
LRRSGAGAWANMYKKQLVIFIILLCFFTAAIQVEAAQFEGSNIKLLKETT